jgi:hypothetical protein
MMEPSDRQPPRGGPVTPPSLSGVAEARRAISLFQAARAEEYPVKVSFAEIRAAIRTRRRPGFGVGRVRLVLAGAALAMCPVLALGAVGVSLGWWTLPRGPDHREPVAARARSSRFVQRHAGGARAKAPVEAPDLAPAPAEPPAPVPPPADALGFAPAPPPPTPPVPAPPQPAVQATPRPRRHATAQAADAAPAAASEVTLVHDALERLRGDNDAAAAMALLDEHDRRFPNGLLRDEAAVTRIEAWLALGRADEALTALERAPARLLDSSPRLQVARGELRAARGHCQAALADFAAAAARATSAGSDIQRRIERGRLACNSAATRDTEGLGGDP